MDKKKLPLPLLIFDDQCVLCTRFKTSLEYLDITKKINFISLNDPLIAEDYPELTREILIETIHFIDENGVVHKGSDAIQSLLLHYPGVSKFSWLIETDSGKKAISFFYDKINELKHKITEDCNSCGK